MPPQPFFVGRLKKLFNLRQHVLLELFQLLWRVVILDLRRDRSADLLAGGNRGRGDAVVRGERVAHPPNVRPARTAKLVGLTVFNSAFWAEHTL